ncbi:MAG TPA: hypothetical protein VFD82_14795 [Planctomycetota bacterium]|nr:hypothetical protein [Planctomycetota bacterium]
MNASEQTRRVEALALLEVFTKRILPGAIRRIAAWKGIRRGQIPDLTDELRQELAVDCLLHADTVVRLPTSERHTRWMRAAERWIYHHRVGRNKNTVMPDASLAARGPGVAETDLVSRHSIVAMGNGRLNLAASAASGRKEARRLRQELEVLATELGCDEQYLAFWRLRLAEALTGLAADLLRDRGAVHLLARQRPAPDPRGRLRRIRRIAAHFRVRSSSHDVRSVLRDWVRRPRLDAHAPRRLLEHATGLHPTAAGTWLWLFEACLVEADLVAALRAVRNGRRVAGADRIAITLARARLLEARDQWPAAMALIRRACDRWPHDARLARIRAAIKAVAP